MCNHCWGAWHWTRFGHWGRYRRRVCAFCGKLEYSDKESLNMSQIKVGDRVQSISGGGSIGTVKAVDDREAWVLFAHNRDHTTRFLSDITSLPPEPKYKAGDRVCDKYSRQNTGKILASHQGETAIWYWVEYESGNCWGKREDELHRADCCK